MKKVFVVLCIEQDGKLYAMADTICVGENILAYCRRFNLRACHLCESRRKAENLALSWNESYKRNGTNLY